MAEEVQAALDRMVPALNDLRERQVFTPEEIRAVVDRRRTQEYNLRRVQPRKADFLRYLQDEMQLEALRKLRVRRLQREEKERQRGQPRPTEHDKTTKHIGDQHIVSHLHHIWTRTLRKYKADVSLYLEYASFCKEVHAHQTLSRVYGEALRLHPNKMNLWIEAASHEFFAAGSVQNARILLQRGLRIHPTAENLWIQHFSLELHFAIKMMGRQQVLQGRLPTDDEAFDRFQLARIVYQSAVSKVPAVRFRVRLWDQCRLFPHTEALKLFILHSIREECGEEPEAWLAWALFASEKEIEKAQENLTDENEEDEGEPGFLRAVGDEENDNHGEPDSKKQKAGDGSAAVKTDINDESLLDILKRATETIQSEEMYLKAGRMVNRYIDDRQAGNESIVAAVEFLETVLEKAARSSFYSADLALEQASFLTRCGTEDKAIACLSDFVATHKDTTASVWIQLASLDEAHRIDILSRASKQLPVTSKDHFCILLHQFGAKLQAGRTEDLLALLERVILLAPGFKSDLVLAESPFGVDGMADVCVQYLKYVHEAEGVAAARRVYGAVLYRSTVAKDLVQVDQDTMLEFFDTAIDAEQSVEDTKERSRSLRRLYDVIIGLLGDTPLADDFRQRRREDLANAR
jgi:U3 small nucleolar RNA-associated protein 6